MSEKDEFLEHQHSELLLREAMTKFEEQKLKPNQSGLCLWCEEPVGLIRSVFCSIECGQDKERYDKANLIMK